MHKIILLIVLVVTSIACNNKKKEQEAVEKEVAKSIHRKISDAKLIKDNFVVDVEVLVMEEDNFQLFYTEEYLLTFSEKNTVTTRVKKIDEFQSIIFNIPKEVYPERYRLDVGSNRAQKKINIKSVSIRYRKTEIVIPQNLINEYLVPNEYITLQGSEYYLNTIEKEGVSTYDPYFTCSPELIRLLSEL